MKIIIYLFCINYIYAIEFNYSYIFSYYISEEDCSHCLKAKIFNIYHNAKNLGIIAEHQVYISALNMKNIDEYKEIFKPINVISNPVPSIKSSYFTIYHTRDDFIDTIYFNKINDMNSILSGLIVKSEKLDMECINFTNAYLINSNIYLLRLNGNLINIYNLSSSKNYVVNISDSLKFVYANKNNISYYKKVDSLGLFNFAISTLIKNQNDNNISIVYKTLIENQCSSYNYNSNNDDIRIEFDIGYYIFKLFTETSSIEKSFRVNLSNRGIYSSSCISLGDGILFNSYQINTPNDTIHDPFIFLKIDTNGRGFPFLKISELENKINMNYDKSKIGVFLQNQMWKYYFDPFQSILFRFDIVDNNFIINKNIGMHFTLKELLSSILANNKSLFLGLCLNANDAYVLLYDCYDSNSSCRYTLVKFDIDNGRIIKMIHLKDQGKSVPYLLGYYSNYLLILNSYNNEINLLSLIY